MNQQEFIEKTEKYVETEFRGDGSGHDWFHIVRVRNMAVRIAQKEGGDLFVVEMAALLHDLDDWKLVKHDEDKNSRVSEWLTTLGLAHDISGKILSVIDEVSFKGAEVETPVSSVEAAIVQDADRLDAIGAIGIARTFAYGGHKNRLIYDPEIVPVSHSSFQEYKSNTAPTINHFYEKLLLLKDRMNTESGRDIAEKRHKFMADYLDHFFDEWEAVK
jgi:Predicted HD superfamily hydrolase